MDCWCEDIQSLHSLPHLQGLDRGMESKGLPLTSQATKPRSKQTLGRKLSKASPKAPARTHEQNCPVCDEHDISQESAQEDPGEASKPRPLSSCHPLQSEIQKETSH